MQQTPGIILTRESRCELRSAGVARFITLSQKPGSVLLPPEFTCIGNVSEHVLRPGSEFRLNTVEDCYILLIPLVGSIGVGKDIIDPDEAFHCRAHERQCLTVYNPFKRETVSFIEVRLSPGTNPDIKAEAMNVDGLPFLGIDVSNVEPDIVKAGVSNIGFGAADVKPDTSNLTQHVTRIHIDEHLNDLVHLPAGHVQSRVMIGKFRGKVDRELNLHRFRGALFMNLCGTFEIQGRLLLDRDAIALWDIDTVAFESLAEESILLVVLPA